MPSASTVAGVLTREQLRRTGEFILGQQQESGAIPWFAGGPLDPWDHVEAAMGLSALGHVDAAAAAYRWSARTQGPDGSWPMVLRDGVVEEAASDTNQCAYLATGLWHHHLVTGSESLLHELWPTLERAIGFVLRQQRSGGEVAWAVSADRQPDTFALRTGSASILHALECALAVAARLGHTRSRWEHATCRLREALNERPWSFADRGRYSMDWYYPVLGGAVRGAAGRAVVQSSWDTFVWAGEGVRCVADRPWVTAAESSELVLALDAVGLRTDAIQVLADIQRMRDEETGGYWTGYVVDDDAFWPVEQTTWTAAVVVLAADALTGTSGGSGIFRDVSRPPEEAAGGAAS